ncbi:MAG TPA: carboxypeptidase regulatory-like domain-containing protein [Vicinamibacterales bacterium]|nr:carboxypeptidase regulatory-like domain-containing protein [Vicinamibacterales bacterium]
MNYAGGDGMVRAVQTLVLTLAVLFAAGPLAAQTNTAEITGVARDTQGGVLAGALVVAVHEATDTSTERLADGMGRFHLPALAVGRYSITATMAGFARWSRSGVLLTLGQQLHLDVVMELGGLDDSITVTGANRTLQTTTAQISDVIGQQVVMETPLNGRNFLALAQLSDSVVLPPGGTRGDALQQAGALPNVGGQRSGHNIYLLDGVKVTDELFNNLVINPSIDAIEEFRIQKSQYPAEFGGKASALINVATRSGGSTTHGSLFEFGRHESLDARGPFDPAGSARPRLRQNQFGGSLGGPLMPRRTFFFGSYEGQRTRRGQTRTFSVPSIAARSGNLGEVQIDPAAIDPLARSLLASVPLPNGPGELQNLVAVRELSRRTDQVTVRIDQRLGDTRQVFGRFSSFDADEDQPFGTSVLQEALLPGFGRHVSTTARNLGLSFTHAFSQSAMNEVRVGWLRVGGGQTNANAGVDFAGSVHLQGVTTDPRDRGYPQISTGGLYSALGDPASTIARQNQHVEFYDNVLLDLGRHHLRFGEYLFHLQFRPEQPENARGVFAYTGQFTGNAFGDFLLGYPASATAGVGRGAEDGRTTWVHAFVQDDWRVGSRLTLNLGLRYEFNQHMRDVNNRLSSIDLTGASPRFVLASDNQGRIDPDASALLGLLPLPYVTSAQAGWDRSLLRPGPVRLAPRTGFALTLDDERAVLRGGYGVFLNQWAYSVQTGFARNLPFFYTRQVDVPASAQTPQFGTADILTADPTGAVSASIMDYAYAVEYTQTWSGGLQVQVAPAIQIEANYMGSWTRGADNATVHNVPEPGPGAIQSRRPIPQLGPIRSIRFDGKSLYHAVAVKAERRSRTALSFAAGYTWSRSMDDASSPGPTEAEQNVPQDVRNIFGDGGEWAPSSFDHRHVLSANATYSLPNLFPGPGLGRVLLGDWRVTAVLAAQSGSPFTVNLGVDRANVGTGPAQRPNQVRDANLPGSTRRRDRWFDTAAFELPAPDTFGTAPRNSVTGPGYATIDLALGKTLSLGDARRLELRWEAFNLTNRANLDLPNRTFGTANFGRIFSAKAPREMQLGIRLSF